MKLKFRLSIMVIAILVVVIAVNSIILLNSSSTIAINLEKKVIELISGEQAEFWKGRQDTRFALLGALADVFSDYMDIEPAERRDRFDGMLRGILTSNPELLLIYTVWRPNAIDGMDAQMIGRSGSTATGQYAMTFTRENGDIETRATSDVQGTVAFLDSISVSNLKDRVDPPEVRNFDGRNEYVVRYMRPVVCSHTNQIVAGIGLMFNMNAAQGVLESIVRQREEISLMGMYAHDGTIFAHTFPDRIGRNMSETETFLAGDLPGAIRAVTGGTGFQSTSYSAAMHTNIEAFFSPFQIGNSDANWSVMVGAREDYILSEVNAMTRLTIILAIIIIVAVAVIIYFVLQFTMMPVVNVAKTLKDIAQGEGDLTVKIAEKGKDEITELSRYFNQTIEKIRKVIVVIKNQSVDLSNIGSDLASNMTQTAAAINQITANIQSIKSRVINQSASVTETNATMEQITLNIEKLNGGVERQTSSVAKSSSAIEEMLANIQSVTQTLVRNAANVKSLTEASEVGRSGLQEVAADIQEISRESEGLMEINSVMENIASQTNLLSMNAAIEAAHAGEAGKGFAVVADEIRKLAESSSEQSKTISTVLKKITSSIGKISKSTDDVLHEFEAIDSSVKTVVDQETNIRNAMEEQGQGSKQVLDAISSVNEITREVKDESKEMLQGSNEVISESKNLEKISQEITGGMNEMASGADQINIAVHQVNDLCGKNRESIDMLVREVSRFKVE